MFPQFMFRESIHSWVNIDSGQYAVVRSFKEPPKPLRPSKIISYGVLHDDFIVYPCSSIHGPVAVVQNRTNPVTHNQFMVVSNRKQWLRNFHDMLEEFPIDNNFNCTDSDLDKLGLSDDDNSVSDDEYSTDDSEKDTDAESRNKNTNEFSNSDSDNIT